MKNTPIPVEFHPAGGKALVVEFGEAIDAALNDAVIALDRRLRDAAITGVLESVPTYRSLLIHYDPSRIRYGDLCERISALEATADRNDQPARRWTIPVAYGGAHGPDLDSTAAEAGLAPEVFVAAHAAIEYRVYMLGFAPGFAYLGDLPDFLQASRLPEPRPKTPAGGVSIGGAQTAISSVAMPSAWRFLGQTPVRMFNPSREDPFLLRPGDRVRFHRISVPEFERMSRAAEHGESVADWSWTE